MKKDIHQQVAEAAERVRLAHDALTRARNKYSRCSKPESVALARQGVIAAESAYRDASSERDRLVNVRNALASARATEKREVEDDARERDDEDLDEGPVTRRREVTLSVNLPCTVVVYVEADTEDGEEPDEHSDWVIADIRSANVETPHPSRLGEHMCEEDFVYMCQMAARAQEEE